MRKLDQPIKLPSAEDVGYTGAISGAMMQIVYGDFLTEAGTIPCVHFATNGGVYYWLVSGKPMKSIDSVLVEGIVNTIDFTAYTSNDLESLGAVSYLTTTVDFGYKKVSVKCRGRMDGSSNLIEDAHLVLEQALEDVAEAVSGDWDGGSRSLSRQRSVTQGYKFAGIIVDNLMTVGRLIIQMAKEIQADFWMNENDKLVTVIDIGTVDEKQIIGTMLREDIEESSVVLNQTLEDIINNLLMKYKYDFTNHRYLGNKDGNEDSTYQDINSINAYGATPQRSFLFKWTRDDVHVSKIRDLLFLNYAGTPHAPSNISFSTKNLRHHNTIAGEFIRCSFPKFYKNGVPMENEVLQAIGVEMGCNNKKMRFTCEDMEVVSNV